MALLPHSVRRMLLTGGLVLVGYGTTGQLLAGVVISLAFLLVTTRAAPFESDADDTLSFLCNLQQLLMYIVGLGIKSEESALEVLRMTSERARNLSDWGYYDKLEAKTAEAKALYEDLLPRMEHELVR